MAQKKTEVKGKNVGDILCIGQTAYDITAPIHEPIVEDRKYFLDDVELRCGGGPAFNAAYVCAKWGLQVHLLSRIGKDAYGAAVKDLMDKVGIRRDFLIETEKTHTPYSYIFPNPETGTRTIFNRPEVFCEAQLPFPDLDLSVIHSDGHDPDMSLKAFECYPGVPRLIDAGTCREAVMRVAVKVDYLVCSTVFAEKYAGQAIRADDPEGCAAALRKVEGINGKTAVITLGGDGMIFRDGGHIFRMPAYPVKAVDTTGAGDIFHGAFAYGLAGRLELRQILKLSAVTAGISVTTMGGQTSIPDYGTVQEKLASWEPDCQLLA